jgi:hypothetical protein
VTIDTPQYVQIMRTCPQGRPGDIVPVTRWPVSRLIRYLDTGVARLYILLDPPRISTGVSAQIEQSSARLGTLTGHARGYVTAQESAPADETSA